MEQNEETKLLGDLYEWFQEGLKSKFISEIAEASEFKLTTLESDRGYILQNELAYFYLFFLHLYCAVQKIPFNNRNSFFNIIHKHYFAQEDRNNWLQLLNQRIEDCRESWNVVKGGKLFGVVGIFLLKLRLRDKSYFPDLSGHIVLMEIFIKRINSIPKFSLGKINENDSFPSC